MIPLQKKKKRLLSSSAGALLSSLHALAGRIRWPHTQRILLRQSTERQPKYLSACVKEEYGNTPLALIHETTISIIRQQLRYSNKSIKEICAELDFPTLSFFGKFFREHLGMSPTEYRQKYLEEG